MAQPKHTHKYIPRIPEREENLFLEEYYSGTDTKIYITSESKPETEIAYISYNVSEQLKPLYGYASRTWDDVAVGNRIVTGAFKVSIKNPEEQSTYEEVVLNQVVDKSTLEQIDEMNKQEEKQKEELEWPDDNSGETSGDEDNKEDNDNKENVTPEIPKETFSQEVQDYQIKLKTLGYTIIVTDGLVDEDGEVIGLTLAAILEFCGDHGVIPARKFTTEIKNAIDKALTTDILVEYKINSSVALRNGPSDDYGIITILSKGTIVYVIGQQDIYVNIKTEAGYVGYIRSIFIM